MRLIDRNAAINGQQKVRERKKSNYLLLNRIWAQNYREEQCKLNKFIGGLHVQFQMRPE